MGITSQPFHQSLQLPDRPNSISNKTIETEKECSVTCIEEINYVSKLTFKLQSYINSTLLMEGYITRSHLSKAVAMDDGKSTVTKSYTSERVVSESSTFHRASPRSTAVLVLSPSARGQVCKVATTTDKTPERSCADIPLDRITRQPLISRNNSNRIKEVQRVKRNSSATPCKGSERLIISPSRQHTNTANNLRNTPSRKRGLQTIPRQQPIVSSHEVIYRRTGDAPVSFSNPSPASNKHHNNQALGNRQLQTKLTSPKRTNSSKLTSPKRTSSSKPTSPKRTNSPNIKKTPSPLLPNTTPSRGPRSPRIADHPKSRMQQTGKLNDFYNSSPIRKTVDGGIQAEQAFLTWHDRVNSSESGTRHSPNLSLDRSAATNLERNDSFDSFDEELLVPSFHANGSASTRRRGSRRPRPGTEVETTSFSSFGFLNFSSPTKSANSSPDGPANSLCIPRNGSMNENYGNNQINGSNALRLSLTASSSPTSPITPTALSNGKISTQRSSHWLNPSRRKPQPNRNKFKFRRFLKRFLYRASGTRSGTGRQAYRKAGPTLSSFVLLVTSVFTFSFSVAYLRTMYNNSALVFGTGGTSTTNLHIAKVLSSSTTSIKSTSSLSSSVDLLSSSMKSLFPSPREKGSSSFKLPNLRLQPQAKKLIKHQQQTDTANDFLLLPIETNVTQSSVPRRPTFRTRTHIGSTSSNGGKTSLDEVRAMIQNAQLIDADELPNLDDQISKTGGLRSGSLYGPNSVFNSTKTESERKFNLLRSPERNNSRVPIVSKMTQTDTQTPGWLRGSRKHDVEPNTKLTHVLQITKQELLRQGLTMVNSILMPSQTIMNHGFNISLTKKTLSHSLLRSQRNSGIINAAEQSVANDTVLINTTEEVRSKFGQFSIGAPACTPISAAQIEFTLVTQLSLNRLWMMRHHCERWINASLTSSPHISMAVYVGDNSTATSESIQDELTTMGCPDNSVTVQTLSGYSDEEYPVNALRNLALSAVKTSHVAYVDVDFWVSSDLHDNLLQHREFLSHNPKSALVLPAFQLNRQCRQYRECPEKNVPKMPYNKESLVYLMVKRRATSFDPTNVGGHGSTRYKDWLIQPADALLPIDCVNSNRYEPYLVFRYCHDLPPFQEVFTGYGKNKMTWIMQLRYSGYDFHQVGGSFVVHYPHLESQARLKWNGGKDGQQLTKPKSLEMDNMTAAETALELQQKYKRAQIDQTFVEFRDWLHQTSDHSVEMKVPKCENALNDDEKLWVASNK